MGSHEHKQFLNLAGEFLVAGELNRHFIPASITYGSSKSADVIAHDLQKDKIYKVEVKTTDKLKWVVGSKLLDESKWDEDYFWILVYLPLCGVSICEGDVLTDEIRGKFSPRYFIFTSVELGKILLNNHKIYKEKYLVKHYKEFNDSDGVYALSFEIINNSNSEGAWIKIKNKFITS